MDLGVETRGSKEAVMSTSQQRVDLKDLSILSDSCDLGTKRTKGQSYLQNNECKTDSLFEHWVDIFLLLTLCKTTLSFIGKRVRDVCPAYRGPSQSSWSSSYLGLPTQWLWSNTGKLWVPEGPFDGT